MPCAAVADAQHLRDRVRVICLRGIDSRGGEQRATAGFDLLLEGGEDPCAPIARGRHNDTLAMAVLQNSSRNQTRLVLRGERELIEHRGYRALRRQKIEREDRWSLRCKLRNRRHLVTREGTDDELGALLRSARDDIRHSVLAGVINTHAWALCSRRLVVRGHEPVAYADRGGGLPAGDRQQ